MAAPRRRKTSDKLALRIARAQLRAVKQFAPTWGNATKAYRSVERTGTPQFLQCWAVGRGYSGVTQALDSEGQVWERVSLMEETMVGEKKVKALKDSWWIPLSMQRRALETKEEA